MTNPLADLDEFIAEHRADFEDYLRQAVGVASVSADPKHRDDMRRLAQLAVSWLQQIGCEAKAVPTAGHPVVFGQMIQNPRYPTVLIYNHLDVQPALASEWASDPFTLRVDGDAFYGRGATDDKGPAMTALMAMRYAREHNVRLNFKVVWELEEEIGSAHFADFVQAHQAELACDSVVVSDTIWVADDRPTIPYGLRGVLSFVLKLRTADHDVHSGLAGGPARNPLAELAQVVSQCFDARSGEVLIPDFYKEVIEPSAQEVENFVSSGFTVEQFQRDHQLSSLRFDDPAKVTTAIMARPTFELHGLVGGYDGPGVKTIIPASAEAKISCRLVPNQDGSVLFRRIAAYINDNWPDVDVVLDAVAEPYLAQLDGVEAQAAQKAMQVAFGRPPALVREGGAIGAVLTLKRQLAVPIILLGLSLPSHGYHAVNEHFDWQQAAGGIKMFATYFAELANQ